MDNNTAMDSQLQRAMLELNTAHAEHRLPDRKIFGQLEKAVLQCRDDFDAVDRAKLMKNMNDVRAMKARLKKE